MKACTGTNLEHQGTQELPPGTVYLGNGHNDLNGVAQDSDGRIVLQPQPSNDPNEPLNWTTGQKTTTTVIACLFTLMVFTTINVGTITWPSLSEDLGYGTEYLNDSYAAGLAGLSVGCIIFIPLAVMVGRKPIYIFASAVMVLVNVGQATFKTRTQYLVIQVISGIAGSVNDTIFQMTIMDLFFVHQRATINGLYTIMVTMGAYLGAIPAGYIIESQGWRWVWWWCAILNGGVLLLIIFAFEETRYTREEGNPVVGEGISIPVASDNNQAKSTDNSKTSADSKHVPEEPEEITMHSVNFPPRRSYVERIKSIGPPPTLSPRAYWQHIWRPFLLFARIPAIPYVGLQNALMLCWIAVLATTQPILFAAPPYNFSSIGVGNINIAPFIGSVLGSIYGGPVNDYYVVWLARRRGGLYDPEIRLHTLMVPLLICPLGLFLYGMSIADEQPWIVPLIGSGCVGFGVGATTSVILPYYGDSYRELVSEGFVVITVIRNSLATAMAFAISPWFLNLGVQRMFISAGCICFLILALTIPMIIWGRRAREWTGEFYAGTVASHAS